MAFPLQVAYLARFRIAHRDIKLENIMLFRDDEGDLSIKLIDLGMAAHQPEGELLMTCCGSPHYAAPEIMEVGQTLPVAIKLDMRFDMSPHLARAYRMTGASPTSGLAASSSTP